jgi:hypothetical protein
MEGRNFMAHSDENKRLRKIISSLRWKLNAARKKLRQRDKLRTA